MNTTWVKRGTATIAVRKRVPLQGGGAGFTTEPDGTKWAEVVGEEVGGDVGRGAGARRRHDHPQAGGQVNQPVMAPCPHCAADVRIRVDIVCPACVRGTPMVVDGSAHADGDRPPYACHLEPKVIWTPAACPECRQVYHGTETWALGQAQPAGERF
jgi:hypothetical protein